MTAAPRVRAGGTADAVTVQCAEGVGWPAGAEPAGWVAAAIKTGAPDGARGGVTLRIADRAEMEALNAAYRGQRRATNVLAFPGPQPGNLPAGLEPELGDILICLPVAETEADDQGKTLVAHLAHLVVHGTLHLLGYDHHADGEAEIMEGLERRVLAQLGFPDPYAQGRD